MWSSSANFVVDNTRHLKLTSKQKSPNFQHQQPQSKTKNESGSSGAKKGARCKVQPAAKINDLVRLKRNYCSHGWLRYEESKGFMREAYFELDHEKVYLVVESRPHQTPVKSTPGVALKLWDALNNQFVWIWRQQVVILT